MQNLLRVLNQQITINIFRLYLRTKAIVRQLFCHFPSLPDRLILQTEFYFQYCNCNIKVQHIKRLFPLSNLSPANGFLKEWW